MNRLYINKDWSTLKKLLVLNAAKAGATPKTETLSGSIVTFSTTKAVPLIDCKAEINPVQTGSGDPSPENVRPITGWTGAKVTRTGKNLYNKNTYTKYGWYLYTENPLKHLSIGDKVTFSINKIDAESHGFSITFNQQPGASASATVIGYTFGNTDLQVTVAVNDTVLNSDYLQMNGNWNGLTADMVESANYQIELSSTATPYEPYTGETVDVQFPAMGKNLFNPVNNVTADGTTTYGITIKNNGDGSYTFNGTATASAWFNFGSITLPAGTYTMSFKSEGSYSNGNVKLGANDGVFITYQQLTNFPWTRSSEQETTGIFGINFSVGTVANNFRIWVQIESGSTATSYEPFTNTVYGGTLDVTTGEMVVDRAEVDLGTLNWSTPISANPNCFTARDLTAIIAGRENAICSSYIVDQGDSTTSAINNAPDKTCIINKGVGSITGNYPAGTIIIKDSSYASYTSDAFKTAMSGVQLVYELATPLVYHLTPQEITAISGDNTMWADTGDITVTYRK